LHKSTHPLAQNFVFTSQKSLKVLHHKTFTPLQKLFYYFQTLPNYFPELLELLIWLAGVMDSPFYRPAGRIRSLDPFRIRGRVYEIYWRCAMKGNRTTACRVMSSQLEIVKEIKSMLSKGYSFFDIMEVYLPEYLDDEGSNLLIEDAKDLKKKRWSSNFDCTIRLPDDYIDEIFSILYELDKKANSFDIIPSIHDATVIKILANAIKSIERSDLPHKYKIDLISQVSSVKLNK
jgi:hypothetical protein